MNKQPILNSDHWSAAVAGLETAGTSYVLITILGVSGSTPREQGTKMVVTLDKQNDLQCYGTIGGGHLEYKAILNAGQLLAQGEPVQQLENFPLGAKLGQCCGGSASILYECFIPKPVSIMLFGAGHVGRALIKILADLPCRVNWVDEREALIDANIKQTALPANITTVSNMDAIDAVNTMPANSYYLVMTHNHQLDYDLCRAILKRDDSRYIGLIGSDTKWQRFQMRFQRRDISPEQIAKIHCPIGLSSVPGKLPMEVAVSIAGEIIQDYQSLQPPRSKRNGIPWRELKTTTQTADDSRKTRDISPTDPSLPGENPLLEDELSNRHD